MIKRDLNFRLLYEYRCDERLKTKVERSTRLTYTGLCGGLEHLKTYSFRDGVSYRIEGGIWWIHCQVPVTGDKVYYSTPLYRISTNFIYFTPLYYIFLNDTTTVLVSMLSTLRLEVWGGNHTEELEESTGRLYNLNSWRWGKTVSFPMSLKK